MEKRRRFTTCVAIHLALPDRVYLLPAMAPSDGSGRPRREIRVAHDWQSYRRIRQASG
jgi:hypothetical protein